PPTATKRVPDHMTASKCPHILRGTVSQLIPPAEVRMLPPEPTATTRVACPAIPRKVLRRPEARGVHSTPFSEVNTTPSDPAATKRIPVHATAFSEAVVPEIRAVQMAASGEVRMVPEAPTATNSEPFH